MTSTYESLDPVLVTSISAVVSAATRTSKHPKLGERITVAGNKYIYVYNGGNSQISKGYAAVAMVGCTEFTCTVSSVSGDVPLGVCKHATLTTDTYGWLLTRGYGVAFAGADIGTDLPITLDVNGTVITGVSWSGWGRALSALATGTLTGPVFWQCPM